MHVKKKEPSLRKGEKTRIKIAVWGWKIARLQMVFGDISTTRRLNVTDQHASVCVCVGGKPGQHVKNTKDDRLEKGSKKLAVYYIFTTRTSLL